MKLITKFLAAGLVGCMATTAFAADHRDGDGVKTEADADINDVFAYTNGNNVVLAMTVSPFATSTSKFSDVVQYVFHVSSHTAFGDAGTSSTDIICTFTTAQVASCWVGNKDYVTGDASAEAGISSASGKVKLFAGPRADPFYFFLQNGTTPPTKGFNGARLTALNAIAAAGLPTFLANDVFASGCVKAAAGLATGVTPLLMTTNQADNTFATANVLAITLEIDKSLLIANADEQVAVWASTNTP